MTKKIVIILILLAVLGAAVFIVIKVLPKQDTQEIIKEVPPFRGTIEQIVSTTGTVLPKNRLEIKPPVPGRIESISVSEGQDVKTGQLLAWMSSTERAALLDAARGQGEKELKYWEQAYKPIALLAPIDAEVIVATMQPGQTVTTADAVVVLSDRLIVRAQVDETDIGKVKLGQVAVISLDAYPENKVGADVDHIYYESETVNNVTIYRVDLIPKEIPPFFRSGMNATINFIVDSRKDALLIPLEALHKENDEVYVLKINGSIEPTKQPVVIGMSDDKNAEIISGIGLGDKVVIKKKKINLQKNNTGSNPFSPFGARGSAPRTPH